MENRRDFILLVILISGFFYCSTAKGWAQTSSPNTVMLILGSANPKTLEKRVEVGLQLYHSDIEFDQIIVSGGCGAHDSSICEASRMDSLLQLNGVPAEKII